MDQTLAAEKGKYAITPQLMEVLDTELALHSNDSKVIPENIIKNIMSLNIYDSEFQAILKDTTKNDVTKLADIKKYAQTILRPQLSADGLILHYPLDNMSGGTVKNIAAETMGDSKYDGKVYGGAQIDKTDYKYGQGSMLFRYNSSHGNTDYIQIPSIPNTFYNKDIFQGFTFATWYQNTPNSKPWARLFEFAVGGGGNHTILASVNFGWQTNYTFIVCGSDQNEFNVSMTEKALETGKWIHIATTISKNGTYTNYINGVATASNYSTSQAGLGLGGTQFDTKSYIWRGVVDPDTKAARVPSNYDRQINYIGKSAWYNGDGGFDGRMNDFRIYRKALTDAEIKKIYNLKNPEIEYKFNYLVVQINSKPENVILNKNNTVNSFLDQSGKNNSGYPKGGDVQYCPKNKITTIPSGQYIDVSPGSSLNLGGWGGLTLALVVNVKNFNPQTHRKVNYLIGSNCNAFEWYIQDNNMCCGTSCQSPMIKYNLNSFKANAINIFILKIETNTNHVHISINGIECVKSQNLSRARHSGPIYIGRGPTNTPWNSNTDYWSSDSIDFYEFMCITDFYDKDKQSNLEGYLAKRWGLLESLPGNHPARTNI